MPPVPEYVSPTWWKWVLWRTRKWPQRFLYYSPDRPADLRRINVHDHAGYHHAALVWQVCDACRVGRINKISIVDDWQRQGLGRRLVLRALRDGPDYVWRTTGQSPDARKFFPRLTEETGIAFTENGTTCEHISSALHGRGGDLRRMSVPKVALDRTV